jgi:uncharacterized membrane protein YcaP (DUF421 family)
MKKEDIHLSDIHRILFGQAPVEFLIEVFFRTLIIYIALLILLKLLGKRMDSQISIIEMAVMLTLGAIVAVAMQMPDRGLLQSLTALVCVFIFQRGVNWMGVKSEKVEDITQGTMTILVKDGVLQLKEMKAAGITKQNVFATLRSRQVFNLGKVKRVYFEACGLFNVYEESHEKPGLPVFPSNEEKFIRLKSRIDEDHVACKNCGNIVNASRQNEKCANCGAQKWMEAIY